MTEAEGGKDRLEELRERKLRLEIWRLALQIAALLIGGAGAIELVGLL